MTFSHYPNGFKGGLSVRGIPVLNSYGGNVYWVDSGSALAGQGTFERPMTTLDAAVALCTANNGDIILIKPGHAETLTAADQIDLDVASIGVRGLGSGTDMPTFTYTVAAGEITVGADNVTIEGIRCISSVTAVLKGINVEDGVDYTTIRGCVFGVEAGGTDEFNATIYFENNNTGALIEDNLIDMQLGGAVQAIHLDADTEGMTIRKNTIRGDYSTACISGDTTLSTEILIEDNLLINGTAGDINAQPVIELLTGTTGTIRNNHCVADVSTPADAIVADTCFLFGNQYSETAAAAALDLPLKPEHLVQVAIKNQALDAADDLFDINTGNVICYALYATCEVDGTGTPVISLQLDADTGSDEVLATGIDIAAVNVDDTITITNGAIAINDAGADTAVMSPIILRPGVVESVLDSGSSGNGVLKWHLVWAPLDSGATVTDAA